MKIIESLKLKPENERECMTELIYLVINQNYKTETFVFKWEWSSHPSYRKEMTENEGNVLSSKLFKEYKDQFDIINLPYFIKTEQGTFKITVDNFQSLSFSRYNSLR